MPETTTDPNKTPNYIARRLAAATAITALAIGGGSAIKDAVGSAEEAIDNRQEHSELVDNLQRPDALQEYIKGDQIPHDKAVRLEIPSAMPADTFSEIITKDNESQWDLTQQISPQVDAQGDLGGQPGEQVVVESALVDPAVIDEYIVLEPGEQPK